MLTRGNKRRILRGMDIRQQLKPKQVIDLIAQRVRKRVTALEGVQLSEYSIALYELNIVLDLLKRASSYVERGERNKDGGYDRRNG